MCNDKAILRILATIGGGGGGGGGGEDVHLEPANKTVQMGQGC